MLKAADKIKSVLDSTKELLKGNLDMSLSQVRENVGYLLISISEPYSRLFGCTINMSEYENKILTIIKVNMTVPGGNQSNSIMFLSDSDISEHDLVMKVDDYLRKNLLLHLYQFDTKIELS